MRIAVVAPLVSPIAEPQMGGSQTLLADLARGLVERGHDVRVIAASGSRIDGVEVVDTGVDPATLRSSLFRVGASPTDGGAVVLQAFAVAAEAVRAFRPEVVHVHAFDAPAVDVVVGLGIPFIQVLHLPPVADVAEAVRRAAGPWFQAVTVSEAMRAAWEAGGVEAAVIGNGVPVDRIPFGRDGGPGALFAGRLSPEKGAPDAIAIASAAGVPLTLVGQPYDDDHAIDVRRLAAEAGFEVLDPVPREDLWRLMGEARAVLCPVHWDEPFGLVAAEAQACGTPVVGYRRGALGEVVRDGETGVLVDEGDRHAAARALASVESLDRRSVRRHAEERLGLEAMVDGYELLSAELASGMRTPQPPAEDSRRDTSRTDAPANAVRVEGGGR